MITPTIYFLGTMADKSYLPKLKSCVLGATTYVSLAPITTVAEVLLYCKSKGITKVVSTSTTLLHKLLGVGEGGERKKPSLDNYVGSLFKKGEIEIVFISPLEQLVTVSYGKFLATRFISKLVRPEEWSAPLDFSWEILTPSNIEEYFIKFQYATTIAVDIETVKEGTAITCIGYTAVYYNTTEGYLTESVVLPIDSEWSISWMRRFNWELKAPKIFQNGKYDISYLSRYNAVPYNYLWDTATMFHCWYSELPKDLAFLGAFFIREAMYWKDLAHTGDIQQYYLYNCRDHWTTALVALEWFRLAPQWTFENYKIEFPLLFPCHLAEMTGLARDSSRLQEQRALIKARIEEKTARLQHICGWKINTNSPVQMKLLCKILGAGDIESTDEKNLTKVAYAHPLNAFLLGLVLDIRGDRKLCSTYLRSDEDITATSKGGAKEYKGRILYALNPHGTDTGRLASREHHFWCGLQIQNIPRGSEVKSTIVADEGFLFAEVDREQAESRGTAVISGDAALLAAVNSDQDFHSINASAFFGKSYEEIYDDQKKKTKDKALRDLAKRTNHGATYVMGPAVMVDTMGYEKVEEARILLGLSKVWSFTKITEYLLEQFHKKYSSLHRVMYPAIVQEIVSTKMLRGATGWTRYCFGRPDINKRDFNSYVAHCPQSLNAQELNVAWMRVFYEIAMNPQHSANFKLCAQIHDSILFQFRIGHEYLIEKVKECMENSIDVKGYDGVIRKLLVPAAIKAGPDGKGIRYWDETE